MEIDRLQSSLARLGIQPSDYRMLKLLPFVYVAWADGKMDRVQKERIHAFAAKRYELSAAGSAPLQVCARRCRLLAPDRRRSGCRLFAARGRGLQPHGE